MLVSELITECTEHIGDPEKGEIGDSTWLTFVKTAARLVRSSGWLLPLEDDTSIICTATDYEYLVPDDFAYVTDLFIEETINGNAVYRTRIPRNHYEIRNGYFGPVFSFNTQDFLAVGKHIKVTGQKRPTVYTLSTETLDAGMEGYFLERVLFYGYRRAAVGRSELAQWRQSMAQASWQSSEMLLKRHPQEFRCDPDAIYIPGRN